MAVSVSNAATGREMKRSYPALSRPLTLLGCERRLFFGAACLGAAAFSSFSAPLAGLLLFGSGYVAGLLITRNDPALPAVLLRSASCKRRYDPARRSSLPVPIRIEEEN